MNSAAVPGREAPAEGGEVRGAAQLVKRRPLALSDVLNDWCRSWDDMTSACEKPLLVDDEFGITRTIGDDE